MHLKLPMSINLSDTGIDPRDRRFKPFLKFLQGNILKPHGREHVVLLLLSFDADPQDICQWFKHLASSRLITSAWHQFRQTREFRKGLSANYTFGSLFLSYEGYRKLRIPQEALDLLFGEAPDEGDFPQVHFRDGMAAARHELGDPRQEDWEHPYRQKLDAMLLLADQDIDRLQERSGRVIAGMYGIATLQGQEQGRVLRNGAGEPIEHFGYADGISQPLFFSRDLARARKHHGTTAWDPSAPLGLVLVPDPLVAGVDSFGSYLVYRKLHQNVKGFDKARKALAKEMSPSDPCLAGALAVGRFKDGTPVLLYPEPKGKELNNFNYTLDPHGHRCPLQAHIRKTNPRGGTVADGNSFADERAHRIARRGTPYQEDDDDKGLLFMCYQSDISRQFAFIQKRWANDEGFPEDDTGIDPIIGRHPHPIEQHWPRSWGESSTVRFGFHGFVKLHGGEFFFTPSISFLMNAEECLAACGAKFPEKKHAPAADEEDADD